MSAPLLIGLVVFAVVAWRALRAYPVAVLAAVAMAGWLGHQGVLAAPAPVREAARSAEAWREARIGALRCRAAVLAALASADDDQALQQLEAACARRGYRLKGNAAAHRHVRPGAARTAFR